MTRLLLRLVIAISLVGCTTGSELLREQDYPAIEDHTASDFDVRFNPESGR